MHLSATKTLNVSLQFVSVCVYENLYFLNSIFDRRLLFNYFTSYPSCFSQSLSRFGLDCFSSHSFSSGLSKRQSFRMRKFFQSSRGLFHRVSPANREVVVVGASGFPRIRRIEMEWNGERKEERKKNEVAK